MLCVTTGSSDHGYVLDGPWNSWECMVQCNVVPEGVQIMGKCWMVPGTHGSVEFNVMCHHRELRSWVCTR